MILIGEKLNSSIPSMREALINRDEARIVELIRAQEAGGADFLDINTATAGNEPEDMRWVIGLVCANSGCGLMLDSTDPAVLAAAAEAAEGRSLILNSVTADERLTELLPTLRKTGASVVGLPLGARGEPTLQAAERLIAQTDEAGIPRERVLLDCLTYALSAGDGNARECLHTLMAVKERYPHVKTVCGASNISFGLPGRGLLNAVFLGAAVIAGLDAAITDVTSERMRDTLAAAQALAGNDEYCMEYIGYMREKKAAGK